MLKKVKNIPHSAPIKCDICDTLSFFVIALNISLITKNIHIKIRVKGISPLIILTADDKVINIYTIPLAPVIFLFVNSTLNTPIHNEVINIILSKFIVPNLSSTNGPTKRIYKKFC